MPFDPTVSTVQFANQLSDLSVSWMQEQDAFIWNRASTVNNREEQTGQFIEYSKPDFFRNDVEPYAGGEPPITGHGITRQTYLCQAHSIAGMVDDILQSAAAPPYEAVESLTRQLMLQHMINADALWATTAMASGSWTRSRTGVASSASDPEFNQWDDASSDPIADIDLEKRTMLETTGKEPNTLVLGYEAWHALKENPTLVSRWQQGPPAAGAPVVMNEQIVANILGLDRIIVAKATNTTSNKGAATATFDFVVNQNDGVLMHIAPSGGLNVATAMYAFVWTGFLGTGTPFPVFTGRKDFSFADWVAVFFAVDFHVVSADLGVFFDNIVGS